MTSWGGTYENAMRLSTNGKPYFQAGIWKGPKCLEIACFDIDSALAVAQRRPMRIEFSANHAVGGTTPSVADVRKLQTDTNIPLNIMIRPRGGNFVYTNAEIEEMKESIKEFLKIGPEQLGWDKPSLCFVFGVLDENNRIDELKCKELVEAADGHCCTFHRAFDEIPGDQMLEQVKVVLACGFKYLLTTGGKSDAVAGKEMLWKLSGKIGMKLTLIVGGGVRSSNLGALKGLATWYHTSAIVGEGNATDLDEVQAIKRLLVPDYTNVLDDEITYGRALSQH